MSKRILLLLLVIGLASGGVWAMFRFGGLRWQRPDQPKVVSNLERGSNSYSWAEAVEKVKAYRTEPADGNVAFEIPPELKHYSDRHWFLATQVAEIRKYNVRTSQDFVDLAAMIRRGEIVGVPAVTETYVLYGVGENADDSAFSRFQNDRSIDLYNEAELADAYRRVDEKRSKLLTEIAALEKQSGSLKKRDRKIQGQLQKQIATLQQGLSLIDEDKAKLDEFYGQLDSRQELLRDYESLQALARYFAGRSFNIEKPSDRQAMKLCMLSSLRPEALKMLEEVASTYHRKFNRPLPVSSLVRPEQYQHVLSKVNRNAVLIETPPHSTGLAFDIDYRYMSAAEQTYLMGELARLKKEGRIEAIRERSANYHVFAFLHGTRPSDELITASLDEASLTPKEAHHAAKQQAKAVKVKRKPRKGLAPTSKTRRRR